MSGGAKCACAESRKPVGKRMWVVTQRRCNHSAFNGYQRTLSVYSEVRCLCCGVFWRTKAAYVDKLRDAREMVWTGSRWREIT